MPRILVVALAVLCTALAALAGAAHAAAPPRPDLSVRSLSGSPSTVTPGARLTIVVLVRNVGRRTARASSVQLFLSRDAKRGRGDVRLGTAVATGALRAGRQTRRSLAATLPRAVAPGVYYPLVCADPSNRLRERREGNNCKASGRLTIRRAASPPVTGGGSQLTPPAFPSLGNDIIEPPPGNPLPDPILTGPPDLEVTGRVVFQDGTPVEGASVVGHLGLFASADVTGAAGGFSLDLGPQDLPADVVVEVHVQPAGLPAVDSARTRQATDPTLDVGTIILPNPAGAEIPLTNGSGQSADGAVKVEGLPAEVTQFFARAFDPDANADAFPGEFEEMGQIPLNSAVFAWGEALDSGGDPVNEFAQAATIRVKVPKSQWADLEDILSGTDRIEIPLYFYDETDEVWEQAEPDGWLEDGAGTVLPEDAQPTILDGSFPGDVFATLTISHLSWMNVDYAYIGPWTLSRLDRDRRNVDCLFGAMQLAKTIARSRKGIDAYKKFDPADKQADADVLSELADRAGPELKSGNLGTSQGEFKGNEQGDQDDQLYLNQNIWNGCGEGATEEQKKNTTLLMATTLVHETAHWKWDVKHEGGNWRTAEPGGEAGDALERELFGGDVDANATEIGTGNDLTRDGAPLTDAQRDQLLDPATWPAPGSPRSAPRRAVPRATESPLEITIARAGQEGPVELGQEIPILITYKNTSTEPIRVLDLALPEGYPIWFEIVREGETERVPFRGVRGDRVIDWSGDFATLQPGATLEQTVNLIRDAQGKRLYNLIRSGDYDVKLFYSGHWGLPETASNVLEFTVGAGGAISGRVTNATNGQPISGAQVRAIRDGDVIDTATTDQNGDYSIPELPPGAYDVEARAPGFLRTTREDVAVASGQTARADFSLSPFLAQGQLRLVLSWGQAPADLDSHLWLPEDRRYHVFYSRRGSTEQCPFAMLDTDDTNGLGPETITLSRRFEGSYRYTVLNFSGTPALTASQARVEVFDSTGLIATIEVPAEGEGAWWHVLDLNGTTGEITEVNTIGPDPAPYPDTATGCEAPG